MFRPMFLDRREQLVQLETAAVSYMIGGLMALCELHQAVQQGDLHRVSTILGESPRKVDIDQADHKGWTPLMYALSNTGTGTELLRTLIRHGATIDQPCISIALDDPKKLAVLIELGADIGYETEQGYDALVNAAYGRDVLHNPRLIEVLELLIANGVSLRGMTTFAESAVRVLSRIGRFDAVQLLLKAGANPDDIKFTKLIEAVAFGTLADMAKLVNGGANTEERDYWERTAWLFAIQSGDISKASFSSGTWLGPECPGTVRQITFVLCNREWPCADAEVVARNRRRH